MQKHVSRPLLRLACVGFMLHFINPLAAQQPATQDSALARDLVRTGYVHQPLELPSNGGWEERQFDLKLLRQKSLPDLGKAGSWIHSGFGNLQQVSTPTRSGRGSLQLTYPKESGVRATGSPSDPDYAVYGNSTIRYPARGTNWESYNRLEFFIYPMSPLEKVVNINIRFVNEEGNGAERLMQADHLINLKNGQWNRCWLDLSEFHRNKVKEISFNVTLKGIDPGTGTEVRLLIDDFRLLQVDDPNPLVGWQPAKNQLSYSTSGYLVDGTKTAIASAGSFAGANTFQLMRLPEGKPVFRGPIQQQQSSIGNFKLLDFSAVTKKGDYLIQIGNYQSDPFRIDSAVWTNSQWRILNFIFCQRCGYAVPGKHSNCHADLFSKHKDKTIAYNGGWHDAGDLSQQTLQTADVSFALLEAYRREKVRNPLLAARLLEEASWGLDFVRKSRYGDGFRASSMGLLIWQDGIIGTKDDIYSVRVQDHAFDNFLYAGYQAYAAATISDDPGMASGLLELAEADFQLALTKHGQNGFGKFIHFYEHQFNTSESQYHATISWAASLLFQHTGKKQYADLAVTHIRYVLDCQRKEPLADAAGTRGFFYRDSSRKSIVHFTHQSREQVYMQALIALCETQPSHPDYNNWHSSIRLYGDYLKGLMTFTAPYGMLPGGVYHKDEAKDSAAFFSLHLFPPANARELFEVQIKNGVPLDSAHYLKRFPVWFSIFNGNQAILLSTGKAAAIAGKFLQDEALLQIGREQLYWTVGKNPFRQSLIYGEGFNFPKLDNFSSGDIVGATPVGIRSKGDTDVPYWPATNNATYKEVWVTSAGKWLSLVSEF